MPANKIKSHNKDAGSNKATGRKYGASQLRSNRKNQDKRVELNREARKRGIYGKRFAKGKDLSHGKDGSLKLEARKKNRARNGQNGKSTKR